MTIVVTHDYTQWLSLEQIRQLLASGELEVPSPGGTLRLFVNFIDRTAAQELARKGGSK